MIDEPLRPDPDALLAQSAECDRGKLKIYFGAYPGAGKTWAMLQEAQRLRAQGLDVLIGIVETHGRPETAALIQGLELLPGKRVGRNKRTVFDLEGALARHPAVIVIDELANTQFIEGKRILRWQEVDTLLEAGIDVLTTINVQHLEGLQETVSFLTGTKVRETIPDAFFDSATDVVLVDLPPDDLRKRIKDGKVFDLARAGRALASYYNQGNLHALRELALRRTADRVDGQIRAWRDSQGREEKVWHTHDALLLCLNGNDDDAKLVRIAARLASALDCEWHAVFIAPAKASHNSEIQRQAVDQNLLMASDAGAITASLSGAEQAETIVRYARENNIGKIALAREPQTRWVLPWVKNTKFLSDLSAKGQDLDLILLALDEPEEPLPETKSERKSLNSRWRVMLHGSLAALAVCGLTTLVSYWIFPGFSTANQAMLYLLGVVVIAVRYGRIPSAVSALINIVAFDLVFVAPHWQLAISDSQYLVTFTVMLVVGLIIGNLTAGMRVQSKMARFREQRARYLYEMAGGLNKTAVTTHISQVCQRVMGAALFSRCEIWISGQKGELIAPAEKNLHAIPDPAVMKWSFDNRETVGAGTRTLSAVPYKVVPLQTNAQVYGLLAIESDQNSAIDLAEYQRLLDTFCMLIADSLERLTLVKREQISRLASEREGLRNSLLAGLSHDLRTPLTVLYGQAELLERELALSGSLFTSQAQDIREHTREAIKLVNNILELARIESPEFALRINWESLEEIMGSAVRSLSNVMTADQIKLDLPTDLLLFEGDGVLLERVITLLAEWLVSHTSASRPQMCILVEKQGFSAKIEMTLDHPEALTDDELFSITRCLKEENVADIQQSDIALILCRKIITLHHGSIEPSISDHSVMGYVLTLPLTDTPLIPDNMET